jgi:glycosyltransferase involved in cell wall biosynthesis
VSKSVLLVAQLAPPSTLVAARRVGGMTKYLARLGYRVTVLTSGLTGEAEIEGAHDVLRTGDLMATRLNWRRGHFEALGGEAGAAYSRPSRLEKVVVPDLALVTWLPFALGAARRVHAIDCVVSSSPPPSTHAVGALLRRRGVPWIAELRDGWTFEPPHPAFPTAPQRAADRALERSLLRRADAVVAVTRPIVEDARDRLGVRAELVTNGFDPEEEVPELSAVVLDPAKHSLVHTGRMAIARSTPAPLLDALRLLPADAAERLEVVFAGPMSEDEQALLDADDLRGRARAVGALPRAQALALQRAADSLLIVTEGSSRRSVATGKIFEYLAADRPILVLGDETEAARIVAETGTGIATSAGDPAAIACALERLLAGRLPERDDAAVAEYRYDAVAARLAAVIDSVAS